MGRTCDPSWSCSTIRFWLPTLSDLSGIPRHGVKNRMYPKSIVHQSSFSYLSSICVPSIFHIPIVWWPSPFFRAMASLTASVTASLPRHPSAGARALAHGAIRPGANFFRDLLSLDALAQVSNTWWPRNYLPDWKNLGFGFCCPRKLIAICVVYHCVRLSKFRHMYMISVYHV